MLGQLKADQKDLYDGIGRVMKNVDAERLAEGYHRGRRGHGEMRVWEGFCVSPIADSESR